MPLLAKQPCEVDNHSSCCSLRLVDHDATCLITQRTFSFFVIAGMSAIGSPSTATIRRRILVPPHRDSSPFEHGCGLGRRRLERLLGCHANLHEPIELTRVETPAVVDGVGPHDHAHPGTERLPRCFNVAPDVILQTLFRARRVAEDVVSVLEIVLVVIDGRDIRSVADLSAIVHPRCRRVLERIRAGANGIARARWSIRVNRDLLSKGMRDVDGGLHFVERKRLKLRDVIEAAGRPVHLYPVRARGDDLAHAAYDGIYPVEHELSRSRTMLRVIRIAVPETTCGDTIFPW